MLNSYCEDLGAVRGEQDIHGEDTTYVPENCTRNMRRRDG